MISSNIKYILENLKKGHENDPFDDNNGPSITINKHTNKVGVFYEKLRYLVDYKEDHSIRRSAIERILKRKLILNLGNNDIGLSLLQELVIGGYLENKSIPEKVAQDIQNIVDKYLILGDEYISKSRLAGIIAGEIEKLFYPENLNDLIAESLYMTIADNIKYTDTISEEELKDQIYIACRRILLGDDYDTLLYSLIIKKIPILPIIKDEIQIRELSQKFIEVVKKSEEELKNPLGWKIISKLKSHSVYFLVIKEIIKKYGAVSEEIFSNQNKLEEEIRKIVEEKYKEQNNTTNRSGTRAVIYILLTKIIVALALEVPYEKIFLDSIDYFALSINILFHPLILLIAVKTINFPSKENTDAIIEGVKSAVENKEIKTLYIKPPIDNLFLISMFTLLYGSLFLISFGMILWTLNMLHFNIISITLFMFFLTLVSYFGLRIRYNARKWKIPTDDESAISILWNFFTIPIVRTGRWLSIKFSSINIFVFIMDFILETPFKFLLGTFDSFLSFINEKKEDPY